MNKRLICFDLDNTILNSEKAHVLAYNKALKQLGLKKRKFLQIVTQLGKPKEEVAKALAQNQPKRIIDKISELHDKYLVESTYKKTKRIRGVIPALKKIKKKFNYKLAILSNCRHSNIIKLLEAAKIKPHFFDIIIGNDDVKRSKPCPDEIFKAQKLAKTKVDYMVGDSIYDIKAGKKAMVKVIAVLTGRYSKHTLEKEKPYKVIKNIKQLRKVIKDDKLKARNVAIRKSA